MNKLLEYKKQKYENLKDKLTVKYNKNIRNINKIIKAIQNNSQINENDTFETIVFKKYLELENVTNVAKYINDLGYRVKTDSYIGERKYIGKDITDILISNVAIDHELKEVVRELQDKNYNAILDIWG